MKLWRRAIIFALSLSTATALNRFPPARACGPFTIDPIFVFRESPDLPLDDFTNLEGWKLRFVRADGDVFQIEKHRHGGIGILGTH